MSTINSEIKNQNSLLERGLTVFPPTFITNSKSSEGAEDFQSTLNIISFFF